MTKETGFAFESEEEAQKACWWWQQQLRLADWDIRCWIRRQFEMSACVDGEFQLVHEHKHGIIKILSKVDDNPTSVWPHDQEDTLVHELLHFHMAPFYAKEDEAKQISQEQMIQLVTQALIRLRRLAYPEPPWKMGQKGDEKRGH